MLSVVKFWMNAVAVRELDRPNRLSTLAGHILRSRLFRGA